MRHGRPEQPPRTHATSSASGDDSTRQMAAISAQALTHHVRSWLARALRTSVHPLWILSRVSAAQVVRQLSINKKRVTIRNNASNTGSCKLVDIVVVRRTFNFLTDLFGLLQYRLDRAISPRELPYKVFNISASISADSDFFTAHFNQMPGAIG